MKSSDIQRNIEYDVMKGISIVAVVLFHLKILTYGYLGVDVFFVLAGFFTALSLERKCDEGSFRYFGFLWGRLGRLMPLILLSGCFCLIAGVWGMLPDDFENLAESVVASNMLSENLLQVVTTKNYWDVSQDYKPLMHLWYVGVLFEFYVIYPLMIKASDAVASCAKKECLRDTENPGGQGRLCDDSGCSGYRHRAIAVAICSVVSLVLYGISFRFPLSPYIGAEYRFYCIHFRFFEFGVGALCCLLSAVLHRLSGKAGLFYAGTTGILALLVSPYDVIPSGVKLVMTVILAGCCIVSSGGMPLNALTRCAAEIGKRSYSIFIWHQIFIAFYRYYFSDILNVTNLLIIIGATVFAAECTYWFVENGKSFQALKMAYVMLFIITTGCSLFVYMRSGIIRDVPELGLYTDSSRRHMHKEYSERIYAYDKDYENNGKIKVFVTGVSYGRDFCNVLLESKFGGVIDLSFAQMYTTDYRERVEQADYVFSVGGKEYQIPEFYRVGKGKYWGVGSKRFGYSNGIVYRHRNEPDYFDQTVALKKEFWDKVQHEKEEWSDNYIDMMAPVSEADGTVQVFTDDDMFISQDTLHLTEAGAKYYARMIDWDRIFGTDGK